MRIKGVLETFYVADENNNQYIVNHQAEYYENKSLSGVVERIIDNDHFECETLGEMEQVDDDTFMVVCSNIQLTRVD